MEAPLTQYRDRIPWHGYGTDDLKHGLRVYPAEALLQKQVVQHNAKHSVSWLVYDIDSETSHNDWQDVNAPPPNIVAINRTNGHAHLFYGLERPIHNYHNASAKALRYMAAIDIALTVKLDADPGYAKLVSKNPVHDRWLVIVPRNDLYSLDELASWLDLKRYTDRRRKLPTEGLGRNCTLFENLRQWAYSERRKEQQYLSEDLFIEACRWRALSINADFNPPLPHAEVRATARSVARWTWRKMSIEGFNRWRDERAQKSIQTRRSRSLELRDRIVATKEQCPDLAQADIAAMCGVSQKTVSVHLRDYTSVISDRHSPGDPTDSQGSAGEGNP